MWSIFNTKIKPDLSILERVLKGNVSGRPSQGAPKAIRISPRSLERTDALDLRLLKLCGYAFSVR
jgi:hypothetical protein